MIRKLVQLSAVLAAVAQCAWASEWRIERWVTWHDPVPFDLVLSTAAEMPEWDVLEGTLTLDHQGGLSIQGIRMLNRFVDPDRMRDENTIRNRWAVILEGRILSMGVADGDHAVLFGRVHPRPELPDQSRVGITVYADELWLQITPEDSHNHWFVKDNTGVAVHNDFSMSGTKITVSPEHRHALIYREEERLISGEWRLFLIGELYRIEGSGYLLVARRRFEVPPDFELPPLEGSEVLLGAGFTDYHVVWDLLYTAYAP